MLPNFTVKNVTTDALRNIYGTNTAQPKSIIGNARQRLQKNTELFTCDVCFKSYKQRSGLWRHKKKCFPSEGCRYAQSATISDVSKRMKNYVNIIYAEDDEWISVRIAKMKDELLDQLKQQNKIIQDMIPRSGK